MGKLLSRGMSQASFNPLPRAVLQQWGDRPPLTARGGPFPSFQREPGGKTSHMKSHYQCSDYRLKLFSALGTSKMGTASWGQSLHNHSVTFLIPSLHKQNPESLQDPPEPKFRTGGTVLNLPLSSLARGMRSSNVTINARPTKDKMLDKYYSKASSLDPISTSLSLFFNSPSLTPALYLLSRPPQLKKGLLVLSSRERTFLTKTERRDADRTSATCLELLTELHCREERLEKRLLGGRALCHWRNFHLITKTQEPAVLIHLSRLS